MSSLSKSLIVKMSEHRSSMSWWWGQRANVNTIRDFHTDMRVRSLIWASYLQIDLKIILFFVRMIHFHQFSHKSHMKFWNFISFFFCSSKLSIIRWWITSTSKSGTLSLNNVWFVEVCWRHISFTLKLLACPEYSIDQIRWVNCFYHRFFSWWWFWKGWIFFNTRRFEWTEFVIW